LNRDAPETYSGALRFETGTAGWWAVTKCQNSGVSKSYKKGAGALCSFKAKGNFAPCPHPGRQLFLRLVLLQLADDRHRPEHAQSRRGTHRFDAKRIVLRAPPYPPTVSPKAPYPAGRPSWNRESKSRNGEGAPAPRAPSPQISHTHCNEHVHHSRFRTRVIALSSGFQFCGTLLRGRNTHRN